MGPIGMGSNLRGAVVSGCVFLWWAVNVFGESNGTSVAFHTKAMQEVS
jgi:hypothetical protein